MRRAKVMLAGVVMLACAVAVGADAPAGGGVVAIALPVMENRLPPGPGRETVMAACVVCHSTRYITMQPAAFTRAQWVAGVDKMRKVFGAPVTDAQAAEVVDYLVAIRGKDEAKR